MRKLKWAQNVTTTFMRRSANRRRPVRLHAERLEDRMLMTANNPVAASGAVVTGQAQRPAVTAAAAIPSMSSTLAAAASMTDGKADQATLSTFNSREEFRTWLIEAATAQWGDLFGQSAYSPYYYNGWALRGDSILFTDERNTTLAFASDTDSVSATNVQVAGVDEADLVETDGQFLYIVSGQDLVIVNAGEGDVLKVVSRVHLDERPSGMYLSGDRLAFVSSPQENYAVDGRRIFPMLDFDSVHTFAGDIDSQYEVQATTPARPKTTVTVLDITDRGGPTLVQKTQLDGTLVASRTVDGELRVVLNNELQLPSPIVKSVNGDARESSIDEFITRPFLQVGNLLTGDFSYRESYGNDYIYETQDEYVARVYDKVLEIIDARIRSFAADGSVISDEPLYEAADLQRPDRSSARNVTTVVTLDLNSNEAGPAAKASVLTGDGAQVYATADSIYVFAQQTPLNNSVDVIAWNGLTTTEVWKFDMNGSHRSIELVATGEFTGTLLNQFAADERDGYLRVVANSGGWPSVGQSVYVLEQVGAQLNVVGSITGIAADESLYSVRFVDDRLFLVTFQQFDPLFAVDLSNPTDPKLLGELHVPGYSDYLQPIDDTHLLAIGRQPDLSGGWFEEVAELQVSIFDVSDLSNPQLTQRYSFGGGSTTVTPATGSSYRRGDGDHHAVSYFADEHILALPINSIDQTNLWWGSATEYTPLFESGYGGLQVFKIDADAGIMPIGMVEHDTRIERSVRIGNRLFAISSGTVSVHDLLDPATELGEVNLSEGSAIPASELKMYQAPTMELFSVPSEIPSEPIGAEPSANRAASTAFAVNWLAPQPATSAHSRPARTAVFDGFQPLRSSEGALLQIIAIDAAHQRTKSNPDAHFHRLGDADFEGHDENDRQSTELTSIFTQILSEQLGPNSRLV